MQTHLQRIIKICCNEQEHKTFDCIMSWVYLFKVGEVILNCLNKVQCRVSLPAVTNYTNGRTDSFPNKNFFQGEVFYYNLELPVFHALYATDFLQPALDRIMPVDRN